MNGTTYFFEQILQNEEAKKRVDREHGKNLLSEQQKLYRDLRSKQEFLKLIQSSNFNDVYDKIEGVLKKTEHQKKQIKEENTHKKDERRKMRKNTEKMIAELFQIRAEIEQKRVDLERLSSESNALQNKHQKTMDDVGSKYHISQLLTESACKEILSERDQALDALIHETDALKNTVEAEKERNAEVTEQSEALTLKQRTYRDALTLRDSRGSAHCELQGLRHELQSMKHLFSINEVAIDGDVVSLQIGGTADGVFAVRIQMERPLGDGSDCAARSVEVSHNGTRYPIGECVLSKLRRLSAGDLVSHPMAEIKHIVWALMLILKRLPLRYSGMAKLEELHSAEMVAWLPEHNELVFEFKMKESGGGGDDDDDQKGECPVTVSIPIVFSVSWDYPHSDGEVVVGADHVIKVEHFGCSLEGKDQGDDGRREHIEARWSEELRQTVEAVTGRFQNDIVGFVQFVHGRLQRFAENKH